MTARPPPRRRPPPLSSSDETSAPRAGLRVAGLFAGVGRIELGLHRAGHETRLLCDADAGALAVLEERFPGIERHADIRTLARLPKDVDMLAAGFPCQDLSQAGRTQGIAGARSRRKRRRGF